MIFALKNKGPNTLCKINKALLQGEEIRHDEIRNDSVTLISFKYAPTTPLNVERPFLIYKYLLTNKCQKFAWIPFDNSF